MPMTCHAFLIVSSFFLCCFPIVLKYMPNKNGVIYHKNLNLSTRVFVIGCSPKVRDHHVMSSNHTPTHPYPYPLYTHSWMFLDIITRQTSCHVPSNHKESQIYTLISHRNLLCIHTLFLTHTTFLTPLYIYPIPHPVASLIDFGPYRPLAAEYDVRKAIAATPNRRRYVITHHCCYCLSFYAS